MTIKSSQILVSEALKIIKTLNVEEVKILLNEDKCTLIDIRDIREIWNEGTIIDSIHIPRGMLEFWLDPVSPYYQKEKFKKDKKLVLFCAAGMRSALATKTLVEMGMENVAHVDGGFGSMKLNGFKIIQKKKD